MSTHRLGILVTLISYLLALVGCESVQERRGQPIDRDKVTENHLVTTKIGLLTIPEPRFYGANVVNYVSPTLGLTLPGRIMGLGVSSFDSELNQIAYNRRFTDSIRESGFKISSQLTQNVTHELEKVGYEVVEAKIDEHEHNKPTEVFLAEYPQTSPPVDFYLHVLVDFAGYSSRRIGDALEPILRATVMLVSTTGHSHLTPSSWSHTNASPGKPYSLVFASTFTYGGPIVQVGNNDRPADPKYALRNDAHLSHPEHVIQGLKAGALSVAEMIAEDLK